MASDTDSDIARHAGACAARLNAAEPNEAYASFAAALPSLQQPFDELLAAIRRLGPQFAFDRAERPVAINVVRQALPRTEREILDALLEDYACEVAAVQEALYQIALASGRG